MIVSIVEGVGEVQAVPVLLQRLVTAMGCPQALISYQPVRQKRAELVREQDFARAIQLALSRRPTAILALFDLDDDCARDIAPILYAWLTTVVPHLPCGVVLARREYEAWFLASVESLRGKRSIMADASYPADPERKRGAKEALSLFMPKNTPYDPKKHQAALSDEFALEQAYRRCSSFRKLVKELHRLLTELGHQPVIPTSWSEAP